jgi:hypothetical protein
VSLNPRRPLRTVTRGALAAGLGALAIAATSLTLVTPAAHAAGEALRITEVAPWGSGNGPYAADWFELTNVGAVALNPSTWKVDDNSYSFPDAIALTGISSIAPGESVIFVEVGAATTPAAVAAAFRTSWNPRAGLQIGSYTGSGIGLSTAGDAVNIFDGAGVVITGVTFGASPASAPFATFDNAAGASGNGTAAGNPFISTLSVIGTSGAFAASETPPHGVGSPGAIANSATPTTTTTSTTTTTTPGATTTTSSTTTTTTTTTTIMPASASPWPGGQSVTVVDLANTYSSNLSGLDYEPAGAGPGVMWAVRNGGPNAMYRLVRNSSGQWVSDTANGWANGKNVLFPSGTGNPDAEGITMGGFSSADGLFVSTERNNDASSTSRNAILRFSAAGAATTLTANGDWNITADLPANGANLGLEAITWVPDSYLIANAFRTNTGALYGPTSYPNHGAGLFFVGVEGSGSIHAYALNLADGSSFTRIATFNSTLADSRGFNSVMDLQFDNETSELWAVCDDGCSGRSAVFRIDQSTGVFTRRALHERPTTMPNTNNEGFTFAPTSECSGGVRPAFWADDNNINGNSLRQGSLPCVATTVGPSIAVTPFIVPPNSTSTVAPTAAPTTTVAAVTTTALATTTTATPTTIATNVLGISVTAPPPAPSTVLDEPAYTGSASTMLAMIGAGFLAAGLALVTASRRRRTAR